MVSFRTLRAVALVLILSSSAFARARVSGYCTQGGQVSVTNTIPSSTKIMQSYPQCAIQVFYNGGAQGYVTTSGATVTFSSGIPFNANSGWPGLTITLTISGTPTPFTIQSVTSAFVLVLTASAGTNATPIAYSMPATAPAAIFSNNTGTALANPFASSTTGYWGFFADNGTYDISASGGGIPAPITWSAISVIDPFSLPLLVSSRTYIEQGLTFYQACTSAAAQGLTLVIDQTWYGISTSGACAATVQGGGGLIQPASGQTVTLTGSLAASPSQQIFDATTNSGASVAFAVPAPEIWTEWFGGSIAPVSAATDTVSAPFQLAQASLPTIPKAVNNAHAGTIRFHNTGVGTNAYLTAKTLTMTSQTSLVGDGISGSKIGMVSGSGFTGTALINLQDANGTGDPNTNFNARVQGLTLDTITNTTASNPINGLSWGASLNSEIEDTSCYTYGICFLMGGSVANAQTIDTTRVSNISATILPNVSHLMLAQAMLFPQGGLGTNDDRVETFKIGDGSGTSNTDTCGNPAIDLGSSNINIRIDNLNAENVPCVAVIGTDSSGEQITHAAVVPDGGTFTNYSWAFLISPRAKNVVVSGIGLGYNYFIILGEWWRATGLSTYSVNSTIIDRIGHIQQVTSCSGACAQDASYPAFSEMGGTVVDGTITWTDEGAVSATCRFQNGVNSNCAMPTLACAAGGNCAISSNALNGPYGITGSSDTTQYSFWYDSNWWFNQTPYSGASITANFNTTADQAMTVAFPPGYTRAVIRHAVASNPTASISSAVGGIYTGAAKTGCILVPASQAYSFLTGATSLLVQDMATQLCASADGALITPNNNIIYFSLTTPEGSPGLATVTLEFQYLP